MLRAIIATKELSWFVLKAAAMDSIPTSNTLCCIFLIFVFTKMEVVFEDVVTQTYNVMVSTPEPNI